MRFVLDSGRRIGVHLTRTRAVWPVGDGTRTADERLVVFCHCAPGAGVFDPDPVQTQARKVTLLSVDRPGYGRSDPVSAGEWATVGFAADDIAAVLDTLDVERVGVAGCRRAGASPWLWRPAARTSSTGSSSSQRPRLTRRFPGSTPSSAPHSSDSALWPPLRHTQSS